MSSRHNLALTTLVPVSAGLLPSLGLTATSRRSTGECSDCHPSSRRIKRPSIEALLGEAWAFSTFGNQIPELYPQEYLRLTDTSQCYLTTARPSQVLRSSTLISMKHATMAHILDISPLYLVPRVATREAFPAITSIYKTDKGAHSWSSAFERLNDGSERTLEA